jgi:hypothetical protein
VDAVVGDLVECLCGVGGGDCVCQHGADASRRL